MIPDYPPPTFQEAIMTPPYVPPPELPFPEDQTANPNVEDEPGQFSEDIERCFIQDVTD